MEVVPDPGAIDRRLAVERKRGFAPPTDASVDGERWLTPGVRGIGTASFLVDVGHEIPDLYNTRRRHSAADGLPPVEFERIISEARSGICTGHHACRGVVGCLTSPLRASRSLPTGQSHGIHRTTAGQPRRRVPHRPTPKGLSGRPASPGGDLGRVSLLGPFFETNAHWLTVFQLPTYAPDLSAQEGVWTLVKRKLKQIMYRALLIDGCLAGTNLLVSD